MDSLRDLWDLAIVLLIAMVLFAVAAASVAGLILGYAWVFGAGAGVLIRAFCWASGVCG